MPYKQLILDSVPGKLYFGPAPDVDTLRELVRKNVKVVWNLLSELSEIAQIEQRFFKVVRTPIIDYNVPDDVREFSKHAKLIAALLKTGANIYVHCLGGHGRTGMALATLVMLLESRPAEEALEVSKQHCFGPELESQKEFVRQLKF